MLKKLKDNLPLILKIGIYFALFVSLLYPYRDKDWGWHYEYGKYFIETGHIMVRDIYSWSLAGYAWINHSWAFDPILYTLYNRVGYFGLSLAGALIALFAFYLLTDDSKLSYWQLGIVAFFYSQLIETGIREGLRSQVLALLPLACLMYLLKKGRDNQKYLWIIPLVFLVWANLHGTFAFGLMVMGAFFATYFWTHKHLRLTLIKIGFLTAVATLLNPFSYHSYLEVLRHTSSPYLQNVFEWLPIYADCIDCHVPTFSLYFLTLILAAIYRPQKSEIPIFLIMLGLSWQTISARRYLPLYLVSTLPLFISFLSRNSKKIDLSSYKLTPFLTLFLIIISLEYTLFTKLPAVNYYHYTEKDYCLLSSRCSNKVLDYLKSNPPTGNGFNFYDWGGYLIGNNFRAKLFIDGRMHLWSVKGYSPFGDYIKMYYGGESKLFNQYGFSWALVEPNSPITKLIESGHAGAWRLDYYDDYSRYYVRLHD